VDGSLTTHITRLLVDPELNEALTALQVAKNHLDQAVDQDMVEAACYEITAAELRLRAIIRRAKAERGDMVDQVDASRKRLFEDQGAVPRVWPHGGRATLQILLTNGFEWEIERPAAGSNFF